MYWKPNKAGTQLLVDAESGKPYVVMSENDGHGHGDGDDDEDDHMHFDPSAHSTLRKKFEFDKEDPYGNMTVKMTF